MQDEVRSESEAATNVDGDEVLKADRIENNNVDASEGDACPDVSAVTGDEGAEAERGVEEDVAEDDGDPRPDEAMETGEDGAEKEEEKGDTDKTFLDDINLDVEEEKEDDDDTDKPADKINMIEHKAVIINIDKTKTNDEIEDYLFDNYPDCGLKSFKVIRRIPYRVVVVFESKEKCEEFLAGPLLKEDLIGFKNKMKKLSLVEFRGQAAERRKMHEKISEGLVVSCQGFDSKETSESVLTYMKDNHEEVSQVDMKEDGKVTMTFATKSGAARFAGLTYAKCRGRNISRTVLVAVQRFKPVRTPLVNGTNELNKKRKLTATKEHGSSFKLTGFQNSTTTYKTIQESLHMVGLNKNDVQFVRYSAEEKEAVVTLRSGNVSQALDIFKQRPVFINKDKISAENVKSLSGEMFKPKRFKGTDNPQKNIRAWTHY